MVIKLMTDAVMDVIKDAYGERTVPFVVSYIETITATRYNITLNMAIRTMINCRNKNKNLIKIILSVSFGLGLGWAVFLSAGRIKFFGPIGPHLIIDY